ncbi:hypothetical protein AB0E69_15125 [Kribbella sp. NPDC026611]|uniref:hypothetical protein n=1 Tax=Kribbella sp. NPDC026611 TaxID=3154911 RepID=UPI0033D39AFB
MSEPTSASAALAHADAGFWRPEDLMQILAGSEPLREDESFELSDLSDDEWDRFIQAIHE